MKCQNMQPQAASLVFLFGQLQTEIKHYGNIRSLDSPTLLYLFFKSPAPQNPSLSQR